MKKFIIIEHEPLTIRLKNIWNIDTLLKKGVNIEYWDMSSFIYPGISIPNKVKDECVRTIDSLETLEFFLSNNDSTQTVYAIELFPNWDNRKIFHLLRRHKCRCIKIDLYANTSLTTSLRKRIISFLKRISISSLTKKTLWLCYRILFLKKIYTYNLSSSSIVAPDIRINHPDFELFKQEEHPLITIGYILFIDTFYPLHPDLKYYYNFKNITEYTDSYRHLMISFFDYLENKYNKRVVIAAHPKSNYSGNEFGEREIIRHNTCNLIKYADFIVTHESNSMSFIALANKPFVIVFPDSYTQFSTLINYVFLLAKICGKTAYNLDKDNWDSISFSKMDEKTRLNYIETYLTSKETENKKNADIWIENLLM